MLRQKCEMFQLDASEAGEDVSLENHGQRLRAVEAELDLLRASLGSPWWAASGSGTALQHAQEDRSMYGPLPSGRKQ